MPRDWTAPGREDRFVNGDCDTRIQHGLRINGVQKTQDYYGACSSQVNQDPANPSEYYGLPANNNWTAHNCTGAACGPPNTTCHFCQFNITKQGWYRAAVGRMLTAPPGIEKPSWKGFLTRLCSDCQIAEQLLFDARVRVINNANTPAVPGVTLPLPRVLPLVPTLARRARMAWYPYNTCTCLGALTNGLLCMRDRYNVWQDMQRPGMPALTNRRVARRNRNKAFLERIALHIQAVNGINVYQTWTADPTPNARRTKRKQNKKYRACRCGDEVVTQPEARIYMCMACEGVMIWDDMQPVNTPAMLGVRHHWNHARGLPNLALPRPRMINQM